MNMSHTWVATSYAGFSLQKRLLISMPSKKQEYVHTCTFLVSEKENFLVSASPFHVLFKHANDRRE